MYAEICGLDLGDGERYSALVQAENGAGMESDFVERKFLLDSEEPKISNGSNIQLAWTIVNKVITISWRGLFNSSSPLSYEISWGTAQYGADVVQWQESTDEEIDLLIPIGYLAIHPSYLTITAINSAGLYKTKMWTVVVDGELDSFVVSN
ncbi:uncharacterized protein LOC135501842 [Lineus longissimus]|uniref:uncharacterized protein LOC135501842 n=1 Tax=Lineus longissimus TaxID=88925 RepID=UPI002B4EC54B